MKNCNENVPPEYPIQWTVWCNRPETRKLSKHAGDHNLPPPPPDRNRVDVYFKTFPGQISRVPAHSDAPV